MAKSSYLKPDTIALHTGYVPESDHGSRAVPVYQTTSYVFESVGDASSLFNVEQGGHIYSRTVHSLNHPFLGRRSHCFIGADLWFHCDIA